MKFVDEIKMIDCPAHKSIYEIQMADSLAKVVAKKATHLPPRIYLTMSDLKNANTQMTIEKLARRWVDSNSHKYKELVPVICKNSLKQKLLQLKNTARRGLSKILRLKSSHCMLISHKSKMKFQTSPLCGYVR